MIAGDSPLANAAANSREAVDTGRLAMLVGYHLRRASVAMNADFVRALEGTGMRQPLFGILSLIAANPGINQGSIGRMLSIQRANMVALIGELVDRGLIERKAATGDRRAFALALTGAGERTFVESLDLIEEHENEVLADIQPAERVMLIELLGRIVMREQKNATVSETTDKTSPDPRGGLAGPPQACIDQAVHRDDRGDADTEPVRRGDFR